MKKTQASSCRLGGVRLVIVGRRASIEFGKVGGWAAHRWCVRCATKRTCWCGRRRALWPRRPPSTSKAEREWRRGEGAKDVGHTPGA